MYTTARLHAGFSKQAIAHCCFEVHSGAEAVPHYVWFIPVVYRHEVKTMPPQLTGGQLPLDSIFAKSQLDQLVAEAWLLSE